MVGSCIVKGCKNIGTRRFPKNEERKNQWIQAIVEHNISGLILHKSSLICSAHFQPSDFVITPSSIRNPDCARKILKKSAVPSIFPRDGPGQEIQILQKPLSTERVNLDKSKVQVLYTYSRIPPVKFVEVPMPMIQTYNDEGIHSQPGNTKDPQQILNREIDPQDIDSEDPLKH